MQIGIASRTTRIIASQTDSVVAPETVGGVIVGQPIIVHGILCENASASNVTFTFEKWNTTSVLFTIAVPARNSFFVPQIFVADAGLQVTTPAGATCTVWHSHPGR